MSVRSSASRSHSTVGRSSLSSSNRSTNLKKNISKSIKKSFTKSEIISCLAECNELSKKQITEVLEDLKDLIVQHLKNNQPFVISGLCKFKCVKKAATKARKSVNPFTGEPMVIKAKPARTAVKILPLKDLKSSIE